MNFIQYLCRICRYLLRHVLHICIATARHSIMALLLFLSLPKSTNNV